MPKEEEKEDEGLPLNFLEQAKMAQQIPTQQTTVQEEPMSAEDKKLLKDVRNINLKRFNLDSIDGGQVGAEKKSSTWAITLKM